MKSGSSDPSGSSRAISTTPVVPTVWIWLAMMILPSGCSATALGEPPGNGLNGSSVCAAASKAAPAAIAHSKSQLTERVPRMRCITHLAESAIAVIAFSSGLRHQESVADMRIAQPRFSALLTLESSGIHRPNSGSSVRVRAASHMLKIPLTIRVRAECDEPSTSDVARQFLRRALSRQSKKNARDPNPSTALFRGRCLHMGVFETLFGT